MQIDRSKFLLLTASIAGAGCGSNASSSSGGAVVVAAPIVSLPGPEATGSTTASSRDTNKLGQTSGPTTDEETLAAADRDPGGVDDSSMCDDGGVAPTGCSTLRAPGPQCESFSDTKAMCATLAKGLKPRVAEKAVDCILAKSGKQSVCDFNLAQQCGVIAARKACIDPSTQSACSPLVRACGGRLAMKECQSLLSAVTSKNRKNMIACMTEGCSSDYCMYQVE